MKLIVDVAHPANIHYFKHFINQMKLSGHKVLITARDKDISFQLLNNLNFQYYNMGKGSIGDSIIGKILYVFYAFFLMLYQCLIFKPDMIISFASSYAGHACFIFRIPHITFEDTEHAKANMFLYKNFADLIITPSSFYLDLGKNHFKMNSCMELFYLHTKRFEPKKKKLENLGICSAKPYVFFRFVSWGAFHDIGEHGLSTVDKINIVKRISNKYNVYISSESTLPDELIKYKLNVNVEDIHYVLANAQLYIGEGGTMASECAVLGTPSIYINSLPLMGYLKDARKNGLLFHLSNFDEIIDKVKVILSSLEENPKIFFEKKEIMLKEKIDPTSFLTWLVTSFPTSLSKIKKDSNIQYKFL